MAVLAMGIGLFSPPLGIGYYGAYAIGNEAVKPMIPYLLALLVAVILIAAIPWISTGFLPKT